MRSKYNFKFKASPSKSFPKKVKTATGDEKIISAAHFYLSAKKFQDIKSFFFFYRSTPSAHKNNNNAQVVPSFGSTNPGEKKVAKKLK